VSRPLYGQFLTTPLYMSIKFRKKEEETDNIKHRFGKIQTTSEK
jgi:hypothetical protein